MIVFVDNTFFTRSEDDKIKDVCEFISILDHGHYIEMDSLVKHEVDGIVENRLFNHQKSLYEEAAEYLKPTKMMKRSLQILNFYGENYRTRNRKCDCEKLL